MSVTVSDLISKARKELASNQIEGAKRDARLLLQHATGWTASDVISAPEKIVSDEIIAQFDASIERRKMGEPVSRIIGQRSFWGHKFIVSPDVLDPRPDTETLVEVMLEVGGNVGGDVLELGVGSGCVLISYLLEKNDASGVGVDISEGALSIAQRNAEKLGVSNRLKLRQSNWFSALEDNERFDLIVSNPPYIPREDINGLSRDVREFDPISALDGGEDGLAPYRIIAKEAGARLKPGGSLVLEIGVGQAEAVSQLLTQHGFVNVNIRKDLSDMQRCVYGRTDR